MKDKYQLLLHIGLPKTASTSLQNNLLYGLHKEGKINFLGKSEGVGGRGFFSDPEIVIMLTSKKLTKEKLYKIQKKMERLLTYEKLNVLSEETLSASMGYDVEVVLHNLKIIFQKCDIKILISLRSIFSIPSNKHLCLEILLLKANADKILTFAKASKPFKSNLGLPGSA